MSDSMLLTGEEVADLTGYSQPSAQVRWLMENGIPHMLGGDGKPKVLRSLIVRRLGGAPEATPAMHEPKLHF